MLKDSVTGVGVAITKAVEGLATAGVNGIGALTGKDPGGNLQYLKLNADNEVVVSLESAVFADLDSGSQTVVDADQTEQVIAKITLQSSKSYERPNWNLNCSQECFFRLVSVDDVGTTDVEDELLTLQLGEGTHNLTELMQDLNFVSGSTGVQELQLLGATEEEDSDISATITVREVQ